MNRRQAIGTIAAGALVAAMAAGCTSTDEDRDDGITRRPRSVLSGLPGTAGRVLAVKIDNVGAARPQTGLDSADLVYAIQVEGGLSRLMAVYDGERLPPTVGPVRSARETDLQLLAQYDRPALAYSGAQSRLLPVLQSADLVNRTGTGDFFRVADRPAPHNEYLHTKGLTDGAGVAKDIGLRFSGTLPPGGKPDTGVSVSMPAARFAFTWNGSRYDVAMDGSRSPWTADNVIVQHVRIKESRFHSRTGFVPFSETVGHGTGLVLRDGRSYSVQWDRPAESAGTSYTHDGRTVPLHPGRTWIVLAAAG